MNSPLDDAIESHLAAPAPRPVVALGDCLRQRFGAHARAILFYGSCRRASDDADGIVDLYVLVDGYREAYGRLLPAVANRLLAPNVYYLETSLPGRVARAKYAVVSLDQFEQRYGALVSLLPVGPLCPTVRAAVRRRRCGPRARRPHHRRGGRHVRGANVAEASGHIRQRGALDERPAPLLRG
jgi:hypothetical protein